MLPILGLSHVRVTSARRGAAAAVNPVRAAGLTRILKLSETELKGSLAVTVIVQTKPVANNELGVPEKVRVVALKRSQAG